jgi:hypothetical protein
MEPLCPVREWEEPPANEIALETAAGAAMLASGAYLTARYRRKLSPLWLAAFVSWFTLCKYLICTRCEHYGKRCEFYGLGKYAARLFPAQPGKSLDTPGIIAEGASAGTLYFLPLLAATGKRSRFLGYAAVLAAALLSQLLVSCRRCALTATTPWKTTCPNYRLARKAFVRAE